ncbi:MAG: FHA domain-containing protein [Bacteroidales bacterium]|jgi:hypothetical protein|nr:FHA domain-containing protein [Bacteroidales bacterium]
MKIIKIGRSSNNDVVIDDRNVTRYHCQIIEDDYGHYRLIDLKSTNGTYINGNRRHGEVNINKTDIVRIGNSTIPWQSYFTKTGGDGTIVNPDPSGGYTPPSPLKGGGFGIASLVLGILGIHILAIVFGVIGFQRDRKNRGLAIAGFVLGCVWFLIVIIYYSVIISAFANF